ncbi:MAG TPA: hypothetical protein VL979_13140 [Solirubrobacteraceae bacterium]|nr:hypothetical protein [Solirubrobacteraceae bacterium]
MARNQLAQRHVDRLALRACPDQLLGFVKHAVVDLNVRSHTPKDTHPKVYFARKLDGDRGTTFAL